MKVDIGDYDYAEDAEREISIEIHKYDTWNLDNTLALVILPALKLFKKETKSYPPELTETGWDELLDEMIWTFENFVEDQEDQFYETNANGELSFKNVDYEGLKVYHQRIQDGLELFGKYYRHLWS